VLNGTAKISQATCDAVFKAVEELNYRPNVLAQSLSTQQTNTIGLVITSGVINSQYLLQLIEKCQEIAAENGKFLIISQADGQPDGAINAILALVDRRCDAILYCHSSFFEQYVNEDILSDLIDKISVPLVVMNCMLPRHPRHCVWLDNVKSGSLPVEYLIQQGHKRIAYIAGPLFQKTSKARIQGYQQTLKEYGIKSDPLLITEAERGYQGGYQACKNLLQRNTEFSAICCFNDQMAIGAVKALRECNLPMSNDILLFGIDNEDILDFFQPSISSVSQPTHELVLRSIELLTAHLNGDALPDIDGNCFSGKLIIRS
jgi:DNA-binding LacI/PurR family transcriptional regulator